MGTWGPGGFENDGVLDWLDEVVSVSGANSIEAVLASVAACPSSVMLGTDDAENARAAAEIVAAAFGHPASAKPSVALEATKRFHAQIRSNAGIRDVAIAAVARVAMDLSELHEVWTEDADSAAQWATANADLVSRLKMVPA